MHILTGVLLSISIIVLFGESVLSIEHDHNKVNQNAEVLLPQERHSSNLHYSDNELNNKWNKFISKNNSWEAVIDRATGKPHKAFGKPIQIEGFSKVNDLNVEDAARKFLNEYKDEFGINPDNLSLVKKTKVNRLWSLGFKQIYKGMDVLFTEVELRIVDNGKVMSFGIDYYDEIDLSITPTISKVEAANTAGKDLNNSNKLNVTHSFGDMFIMPVRIGSEVIYSLVYEIELSSGIEVYKSYVDAHSGELLRRKSMLTHVNSEITSKGDVKLDTYHSQPQTVQFKNLYFNLGKNRIKIDNSGKKDINIFPAGEINSSLKGPFIKVIHGESEKPDAFYTGTVEPGSDHVIDWNNSNSTLIERNLFYHGNIAHSFYKYLDPDSDVMDYQVEVSIIYSDKYEGIKYGTNAFSKRDNGYIFYTGVSSNEKKYAETAHVMYHEYGHSVNAMVYKSMGFENGMENRACNEGTADIYAAFITDKHEMGRGHNPADPSVYIRNVKNNRKYPEDAIMSSHYTGQILAGAWWDIRENTSLEYASWLFHYTRNIGTPDDMNLETAFNEWFIETLVVDDASKNGDYDLSNGTPNMDEIISAYNKHGIGTSLMANIAFDHKPFDDIQHISKPYPIELTFDNNSNLFSDLTDSLSLVYSTDNFKTSNKIKCESIGGNKYIAFIPKQVAGTLVEYYFTTMDKYSESEIIYSSRKESLEPFKFLVGFKTHFFTEFKSNEGWYSGLPDDNATTGNWEHGRAERYTLGFLGIPEVIQPYSYSKYEQNCFVTGAGHSPHSPWEGMPNGKTTLISDEYDISILSEPVIKYYYWFFDQPFLEEYATNLNIEISGDGGNTWKKVKTISSNTNSWEKELIKVSDHIDPKTSEFQVKFEVDAKSSGGDSNPISISEALVDNFEILGIAEALNTELEVKTNSELSVFPNPARNFVNINYTANKAGNIDVTVYDNLGNEVENIFSGYVNSGGNEFNLDTKDLQSGYYFVKINTGNSILTEKIIVVR